MLKISWSRYKRGWLTGSWRGISCSWDLNEKVVNLQRLWGRAFQVKRTENAKTHNMKMSLVCWARMVGGDVVKNEHIEKTLIHAVLSVWNIFPAFYSLYSYYSLISLLGEAFPDTADVIRSPVYVHHAPFLYSIHHSCSLVTLISLVIWLICLSLLWILAPWGSGSTCFA